MQENFPDYYVVIAKNFKRLRKANNLSQEKFAERISCSREFISRVENYHEKVSLQMLLETARAFDVRPEYFFNID